MVDMVRSPKDAADAGPIGIGMLHDRYPAGLSISLDHIDLDKLGLDSDCKVGDMLSGAILAKVTFVCKRDGKNGEEFRADKAAAPGSAAVADRNAECTPAATATANAAQALVRAEHRRFSRVLSHAHQYPQADTPPNA